VKTARVLARFGPKLPQMAEAALIAQAERTGPPAPGPRWPGVVLVVAIAGAAFALGLVL
jgi:ubiquinone biosynthesis protein